jgi:hypothetical protein
MSTKRELARQMRHQGIPVKEIAEKLETRASYVSIWVRDISLSSEQIELQGSRYASQNRGAKALQERYLLQRYTYQEQGRVKARENSSLHLTGCMLYWAEGAKTRNEVHFVNADPNMMRLFIKFLREELEVEDTVMAVKINCHATDEDEIQRIEAYWLDLLQLPTTCLKKTQIKMGSPSSRKNILSNGVCGLRVPRTEVIQHIYGAIQEYGGFENPDWLF